MDIYIVVIKFISLMLSIWFTTVNTAKVYRGHPVSIWNLIIMSFSITLFIFLQFNLF